MTFVGLDPARASQLADHLDEAARDLEAHAERVAAALAQAGLTSCEAPREIREVAAWAAYRSRDLRRRIARIVAASQTGPGPRTPGFRFASLVDASKAARAAEDNLNKKSAAAELRTIVPYLADLRFSAALFKRLGPKRTFELLSAAKGNPDVAALGRALAAAYKSGAVSDKFLDGIVEAARKNATALNAYVHPWASVNERDRVPDALNEYEHGVAAPPGTYKFLESTAPLVPYLEAGARVAIIGGAVVILTAAGACVALSEGACAGSAEALADEGAVIFSGEAASVPTGLFETLPMSLEDESMFARFIDIFRTALPRAQLAFRGSAATGVKWASGELFNVDSDIDLAVVDDELFTRAQQLGLKLWGVGTRTPPLYPSDLERLGIADLQAELSEIAGHRVSIMLYRSMDDLLARGPAIVLPGSGS